MGYPHRKNQLIFIEGVFAALLSLQSAGYYLFIVSNQSGIGRGYFDNEIVKNFNSILVKKLAHKNIKIHEVKYCPHIEKDKCECRKPNPGMILDLVDKYSIDRSISALIGDKDSDIEAGMRAGLKINLKIDKNSPNALISACDEIIKKFKN